MYRIIQKGTCIDIITQPESVKETFYFRIGIFISLTAHILLLNQYAH